MELRLIITYFENKNVYIFLDYLSGLNVILRVFRNEEENEN